MMKKHLFPCVQAAIVIALATSCAVLPVEEDTLPPPVIRAYESVDYSFVTVKKGDLSKYVDITAVNVPAHEQRLAFSLGGILIKNVYVKIGDAVKTGDLLAELERDEILKKLDEEEFALSKIDLQIKHANEVYAVARKYNATDENAHEEKIRVLLAQRQITLIEIEKLLAQNKERVLYATMNGTITHVMTVKDGDKSQEGSNFTTITDQTLSVFVVKGDNSAYFNAGDTVRMKMSGTDYFDAQVREPGDIGVRSPEDKTVYITVNEFPPDAKIASTATIRHVLDERNDTLYLPSRCVTTINDNSFVYVMQDDIRQMVTVTTGLSTTDGRLEILSGLSEGDNVILQ